MRNKSEEAERLREAIRLQATHDRWLTHRNRFPVTPEYEERWYNEQCQMCKHYIRLAGKMGADWGVCSSELSPFDGTTRFEHDGCDYFSTAEDQ